jgi:regulatory protein
MQDRGYTEQVIERVLGQLKDQRYINDERYAEIFLENLKAYRSFGFFGIKKKMMEKKLPQALIDSTLAAGLSVAEEMKIAQRLLKKEGYTGKTSAENSEEVTYRTYEENSENKAKQKMANKLKTRGFRSEVISRLMF